MRENGGTFTDQHRLFVNLRKRIQINSAEKHLTITRRPGFVAMLSSITPGTNDPNDAPAKVGGFFAETEFRQRRLASTGSAPSF